MAYKIGIILTAIILSLLFINLVSAQASVPSIWQKFGGEFTRNTQMQNPNSYSLINNTNIELKTASVGRTFVDSYPTQPLITDFLDGGFTRLICIQDGAYLIFLDKDLNILNEIFTTYTLIGQNQIGDFNNDGLNNEIAGLYRINNTHVLLRYYQYNVTSDVISLLNQTEYSSSVTINSSGVSCIGGSNSFCAFQLGNATSVNTIVNSLNNGTIINTTSNASYSVEPLALDDINYDNIYEALSFDGSKLDIINLSSGLPILQINADASYTMAGARIVDIDSSPILKIATFQTFGATSCRVKTYRIDGTALWTSSCGGVAPAGYIKAGLGVSDYDGDGFDDIWIAYSQNTADILKIYKGNNGNELFSSSAYIDLVSSGILSGQQTFTMARMSNSNIPAIIYTTPTNLINVYNPSNPSIFVLNISTTGSSGMMGCATADLNFDSYNDIICTDTGFTFAVLSNQTNQNAFLSSVSFSPSTIVQVGTSVNALISCSDTEGDTIRYSYRCSESETFAEDFSNSKNCFYSSTGFFNMTLRCRDVYNDAYSIIITNCSCLSYLNYL